MKQTYIRCLETMKCAKIEDEETFKKAYPSGRYNTFIVEEDAPAVKPRPFPPSRKSEPDDVS